MRVESPTRSELALAHCLETVDHVDGDPVTSAFKAAARLHQARWREAHNYPIGTLPLDPDTAHSDSSGKRYEPRPVGSNLEYQFATRTLANFLDEGVKQSVQRRLASKQRHELLRKDRLFASLLSSMPMCFNLFGGLHSLEQATDAVKAWWPGTPGTVSDVVFEWSPGRLDPRYLGNKSAFDVVFMLDLGGGRRGVVGVETKYHEHPTAVAINPARVKRYRDVARASRLFDESTIEALIAGPHNRAAEHADARSQIWLDHLLALSMLQHPVAAWDFVRFVLVYPDANRVWSNLAEEYRRQIDDSDSTFVATSLDELFVADVYTASYNARLSERYRCWA